MRKITLIFVALFCMAALALPLACLLPESVKPDTKVTLLSPSNTETVAPTTYTPTSQSAGRDIVGSGNPTVTTTIGLPWEGLWKFAVVLVVWDLAKGYVRGRLQRRHVRLHPESVVGFSRLDG